MKGSRIKNIIVDKEYRFAVSECGKVFVNLTTNRVLTTIADRNGYVRVWATGFFNTSKRKSFLVHRIVALAWLERPVNYETMDINHKDGNKSNNHRKNLEWCSHKQNIKHAVDNGLLARNNGKWAKAS